jgi:hypothetical protein
MRVVELPDGLVDDGLGQAGDEDLLLDRLVVDQHQLLRVARHRGDEPARRGVGAIGAGRVAQHVVLAVDPLLAVRHQRLHGVAALHRHGALRRLVQRRPGGLEYGRQQARAGLGKLLGEHPPRPARDFWRRFAFGHPAASLPL